MGADHVFDYHSPTNNNIGTEIRAVTHNKLHLAFDCIASPDSAAICSAAISSNGGTYSSLLPVQDSEFPRKDIVNRTTLAYTGIGEAFHKGQMEFPASPENLEFQVRFWKLARELLAQGKIKVHPPAVREGGLERVLEGVDDLRCGKVSGQKLVYRVSTAI